MMKKYAFYFFFLISFSVFSQKNDSIITINPFGKNTYLSNKNYKYGKTIKFKINNVNVFKLSSDLKSEGTNTTFEIPKYFKNNEEGDSLVKAEFDLVDDTKSLKDIYKSAYFKYRERIVKDSKNGFLENKTIFVKNVQKINNYITLKDRIYEQLQDSIFIRDTIVVRENSKALYNSTFDDSQESIKEIDVTLESLFQSYSQMKLYYDEINKSIENKSFEFSGKLTAKDNEMLLQMSKAKVEIKGKKIFEKEIAYANKLRDSILKPETQVLIKKKALAGISLNQKIQKGGFYVYTNAHQLLNDVEKFTPELKDAKGKVVYSFSPYSVKVRGKLKVNFSSGYLMSFLGDDNYSYRKDSTGIIGVKISNKNNLTHSLGGLAHVYFTGNSGLNYAVSSGLSLNDDGNLGFYGGLSLSAKEENRIILTAGLSFTKVNVLNKSNLEDDLTFSTSSDTEIKFDEVYKGAFFIGITYNLSD